jgi:hypothetical protein
MAAATARNGASRKPDRATAAELEASIPSRDHSKNRRDDVAVGWIVQV